MQQPEAARHFFVCSFGRASASSSFIPIQSYDLLPLPIIWGSYRDSNAGLCFLAEHYFPRLAWARLTLNPRKTYFFIDEIKILGHKRQPRGGICLLADKIAMICEFPPLEDAESVERFCYMLPFLKAYILERVDLVEFIKTSIVYKRTKGKVKGGVN
jgi:hypothetical protein